jgi:hypothetical protein
MRLEGLGILNNPTTLSGIETATSAETGTDNKEETTREY